MTTTPIKYLLIGDAETGKQITEYSNAGCTSQAKKIGNQIFQKVVKSPSKKLDERNKIVSKGEIYYFIMTQTNLIFLVLVEEKYPERWNGRATRDWSLPDTVYLNPETETDRLSSVGF